MKHKESQTPAEQQERINEEYGFDHPSFDDPGRPVLSVPDEVLEKIIEDKIREECKHGGARAGAGRPALPGEKRKPRTIWANEEEYEQIKQSLAKLRSE